MADTDSHLQVELVAADRTVWSGPATMVIARTAEGDVGILRNHTPILSLLVSGVVEITEPDSHQHFVAVDDGFISVAHNRVSILAEHAEMSHEIDLDEARAQLEAAEADPEDQKQQARIRAAEARIRTFERAR
ncbi:F-type H+-transporting ATPase subunit epsilon [Nocardioides ginsengisegetis]|uniref:ATP synthase epsilon chain n=1 Tax=Nocardioides ginsengisegetis TaxID=661491 RepID=A0A7W3IXV1_9ACTN|nr:MULTISPECIES: F0F1 ATP synthase subunit epsilon [Nocardioides]MBA8802628.1 F-type H+-transporting ATPase subunit epsilon [Nocardioides ginsengisegetis]GCD88337.1 ATP synthase epsilon chain [Nocardioides sp. LS1]